MIPEVIKTLKHPENRLSHIVDACTVLDNGQAIDVHFDGDSRPAQITNKLKTVFTKTTFNHKVIHTQSASILRIWPYGRTVDSNFKNRPISINSVRMASGTWIDPFNITADHISIEDIAHNLGRICRFNGAVTGFYSVADHCIKISNRASSENKLWGLLRHAAEAYIGDIIRPVKQNFNWFVKPIEDQILRAVADKFGLPPTIPQEIKDLDHQILQEELDLLEKGRLTGNPYYTSSKMFLMVFKGLSK